MLKIIKNTFLIIVLFLFTNVLYANDTTPSCFNTSDVQFVKHHIKMSDLYCDSISKVLNIRHLVVLEEEEIRLYDNMKIDTLFSLIITSSTRDVLSVIKNDTGLYINKYIKPGQYLCYNNTLPLYTINDTILTYYGSGKINNDIKIMDEGYWISSHNNNWKIIIHNDTIDNVLMNSIIRFGKINLENVDTIPEFNYKIIKKLFFQTIYEKPIAEISESYAYYNNTVIDRDVICVIYDNIYKYYTDYKTETDHNINMNFENKSWNKNVEFDKPIFDYDTSLGAITIRLNTDIEKVFYLCNSSGVILDVKYLKNGFCNFETQNYPIGEYFIFYQSDSNIDYYRFLIR